MKFHLFYSLFGKYFISVVLGWTMADLCLDELEGEEFGSP